MENCMHTNHVSSTAENLKRIFLGRIFIEETKNKTDQLLNEAKA